MNREQWLCNQLDREDLSEEVRSKYESELDELADRHSAAQRRVEEQKTKRNQELAEIRARILANDEDFIWTFGQQEFGEDYDMKPEGELFIVYSHVARDDQEHRHVFSTAKEASSKLHKLLWDRLYSKYVRTGEMQNLVGLVE